MDPITRRHRPLRRRGTVALVLAAAGVLTTAACGGGSSSGASSTSNGTVNITLWHQDTGTSLQALNTMVSDFNASQSKVHVTADYIAPSGTSETAFTAKLATALTSGSGPALTWSDSEPAYVPELISTGDVVNLASFMNSATDGLPASAFNPAMLETGTFNGQVYALPCDGGDYAIIYNKKLFAQAGITSTPTTWAELTTDAQKLTKNGTYGFYVPFGSTEWTVWTYESMLWSEGGQFLNSSNTKAEFASPAGIAALNVWLNLIKTHLSYPTDLATSTQSSGYPGFQAGKVAMYIDGSYDLPTDDQALGKSDVGVFPFPATQTSAMNVGTNMAVMFKGSKAQEDATWTFIRYALSPAVQAKYDITAGFIPTVNATAATPAFEAYAKSDPRLATFVNELKYAHTRPSIAAYVHISTDLGQQLESAFLGQTSAAKALSTAQGQADAALSSSS